MEAGDAPCVPNVYMMSTTSQACAGVRWSRCSMEKRPDTAGLDLDVLRALQPRGLYSPAFINPPPTSPLAEFDDEIARMKATPSEQIRAEIQRTYAGRPL